MNRQVQRIGGSGGFVGNLATPIVYGAPPENNCLAGEAIQITSLKSRDLA
jgi:hypothetical protein